MRRAVYDPNNPVPLKATLGTPVMVKLAPDETVLNAAYNFRGCKGSGQNAVCRLTVHWQGSYLFVMSGRLPGDPPDFMIPETPILVLAKKGDGMRDYTFDFEPQPPKGDPDWRVQMVYPHDAYLKRLAAERAAARRRQALEVKEALRRETDFPSSTGGYDGSRNYHYADRGDHTIAPQWVWDNGHTTYFRFEQLQSIPAIFAGRCDAHQETVNFSVHGDTVILPGTEPVWCVSDNTKGRALEIYNLAYDPAGRTPATGTISPDVARVVKGSDAN
jgi:type IV secretion system protein VirB9